MYLIVWHAAQQSDIIFVWEWTHCNSKAISVSAFLSSTGTSPGNMQPCFKVGPVSFSGRQVGPILYTVFQSWADYVLPIYPLWNIEVFFYSHPTRYQNCKYTLVQNYKSNFAQSNKCIGLQLSFFFLNSLYDRSWMSMFISFVG